MEYRNQLLLQVAVCVAILLITILRLGRDRSPSVGLPTMYLLSLAMLHWFGMLIHGLPWFETHETDYVASGGRLCLIGVLAFSVGSLIFAPVLQRRLLAGRLAPANIDPPPRLPETYMILGIVSFFVLMPILSRIPSFAALSSCGVSLLVVGLCLACWRAHNQGNRKNVLFWLASTVAIPAVTVTTMGFMSYGAAAALVVFVFVLTFYRPKWQALLAGALTLFFGLSLFVTYFRDRSAIRESVWGEESLSARINRIADTMTDFELINFADENHLTAIDDRLNQNSLVGRAVENVSYGSRQLARGETIRLAFVAFIPRVFWPGKPVVAGSQDLVARYTGLQFSEGTSVGIGQVMELYINFGTAGVITGFLLIGTLLRLLDIVAARKLIRGNWPGFMLWFFPSLALLQTGGQLSEVTGTAAASLVLAIILNKAGLGRERAILLRPSPTRA